MGLSEIIAEYAKVAGAFGFLFTWYSKIHRENRREEEKLCQELRRKRKILYDDNEPYMEIIKILKVESDFLKDNKKAKLEAIIKAKIEETQKARPEEINKARPEEINRAVLEEIKKAVLEIIIKSYGSTVSNKMDPNHLRKLPYFLEEVAYELVGNPDAKSVAFGIFSEQVLLCHNSELLWEGESDPYNEDNTYWSFFWRFAEETKVKIKLHPLIKKLQNLIE
jgi:hypothetical protein